jgi:magnesium transporter
LGEVRIKDWFRILYREAAMGLVLGLGLGILGLVKVLAGFGISPVSDAGRLALALTVALSVLSSVTWGTLAGSMLPLILKNFKVDPATASAPFVATLVDVTGLVIYFTVARMVLSGTLL